MACMSFVGASLSTRNLHPRAAICEKAEGLKLWPEIAFWVGLDFVHSSGKIAVTLVIPPQYSIGPEHIGQDSVSPVGMITDQQGSIGPPLY